MKYLFSELKKLLKMRLEPKMAWLFLSGASALSAVGMLLEWRIEKAIETIPSWPSLVSSLLGFIILGIVFLKRNRASVYAAECLYVLNCIGIAFAFYTADPYFASSDHWVPFQGSKLSCLAAAMISPSFLTAVISIFVHGGSSVLRFFTFSPELQGRIAVGEPWATCGFALVSIVIATARFRRLLLDQRLQKMNSDAESYKKVNHLLYDLRDLMNTPVQSISLAVSVLRKSNEDKDKALAQIDRNVEKLKVICDTLDRHRFVEKTEGRST